MRNLKRALSLALASVMLLGMMVVGTSAASFPDVDDNDNVEAIEVLKAVNVMIGDNGYFKPDQNVTRNEMAVIMTNMLGLNAKDFAGACPFTDVSPWAQDYVAACYANGIIAGRSATVFDGQASVTAVEAAAMMMRALGYFKYTQDYEGGFVAATVKQAAAIRLFDGVEGNANDAMNRNNVAQLALNTLEADVVDANGSVGMDIDMGDGKKVNVGYNITYDPKSDGGAYNYTGDPTPSKDTDATHQYLYLQLCEKLYDNKLKKIGDANDDFGRPAAQWSYKGEDIIAATKQPVATFTSEMKEKDIFKELGASGINGSSARYVVMDKIYENGVLVGESDEIGTSGQFQAKASYGSNGYDQTVIIANGDSSNAAGFGNGILVEVYEASKTNHYVMVITKSTVAKVTNVVEAKDKTTYTIGGTGYVDYVDEADKDKIVLNGDVAKGDWVTYAVIKGVAYVWPTTSVTGTQTAKTNKNVITVGGEQYTVGTGVVGVDPTDYNNSDKEANYFIDRLGYVVNTTSTAASTDYVFIIDTNGDLSTTVDGSTPKVEARVLLADGTVGVYDLKVKKLKAADVTSGGDYAAGGKFGATSSNSVTYADGDYVIEGTNYCVYDAGTTNDGAGVRGLADDIETMTFGYTTKDKEMTLENIPAFSGGTAADTTYDVTLTTAKIQKDKTSYTEGGKTVLVDRDTKFVVYNSDKKTATVYTGAANLPTAINSAGGSGLPGYAVLKTGSNANTGTASVVFVSHNAAIAADGTDVYVYVDADTQTTVRVDGSNKYTYEFTRPDGTKETSAAGDSKSTGLYLLKEDGTIGDAASAARYKAKAQLATDADVKMIQTGGSWYNITDETQIVYIDELNEINGNDGWVVLKVKDGSATSDVEAVFVVKHVVPPTPTITASGSGNVEQTTGAFDTGVNAKKLTVTASIANSSETLHYAWTKKLASAAGAGSAIAGAGDNNEITVTDTIFDAPGVYTVTCTVSATGAASQTVNFTVTVKPAAPTAPATSQAIVASTKVVTLTHSSNYAVGKYTLYQNNGTSDVKIGEATLGTAGNVLTITATTGTFTANNGVTLKLTYTVDGAESAKTDITFGTSDVT